MAKRKVPPARLRYEAAHPSLTVRVPAAVKARIGELAKAEGLSVSEWVQAVAAEHQTDPAEAYRRGHDEGYAKGREAGRAEGFVQGRRMGADAGIRAGILLDCLAREDGRQYLAATVAKNLAADDDRLATALAAAGRFGKEAELRRYVARLTRTGRSSAHSFTPHA